MLSNSNMKEMNDEKVSTNTEVSDNTEIEQKQQVEERLNVSDIVDITDIRDERIAKLEAELALTQQHERDILLRSKAEMENIRRRSALEVEKAHKFALEHFSEELLPVIDNLERAIDMSDKSNKNFLSTIEGIELTLKSLLNVMRKFGLSVISETNVPFNPEVHQAMTILDSKECEPNHVMMVMQKGYTLNGRLLRPAMVAVSQAISESDLKSTEENS